MPVISAIGPFNDFTDTSGRLVFKLIDDPNGGKIEHTGLAVEPVAQTAILNVLLDSGSVAVNQISQGTTLSGNALMDEVNAVLLTYLGGAVGFSNGQFTLDFDFTRTQNSTINVNVPGGIFADTIPLGMSVTFNFDISFGLDIISTEAGRTVAFWLHREAMQMGVWI